MSDEKLIETLSKAATAPAPVCSSCDGAGVVLEGGSYERCPLCKHGSALGQTLNRDKGASA